MSSASASASRSARQDAAGVEAHRGEVAGEDARVGREHPQGVASVLFRLADSAGARLDQGLPGEIDRDLDVAGAEALEVDRQRFGDERPGRLGVARIVPGAGEHAQPGREAVVPRPEHAPLPLDDVRFDPRGFGDLAEAQQVGREVVAGVDGLRVIETVVGFPPRRDGSLDGHGLRVRLVESR